MSRVEKLYQRLDALEASFREELVLQLIACAEGRNDLLFCSGQFLPAPRPHWTSGGIADQLLAQVEVIRGLKEKVKEPFRPSLAFRFLECCRQWADTSDPQRGGSRTVAQTLLAEIQTTQQPASESGTPTFQEKRSSKSVSRIMYVECKAGAGDRGAARICRVRYSKSGRTVYVGAMALQRGTGIYGNYFNLETRIEYWVSGPKRKGGDRHWAGGGPVFVDADVADEYWRDIRGCEPPADPTRA